MIKAVIFDLDGTLLYTLEDLKNSTNFALKQFDFPQRSLDEIRIFVGNGVRKLIERAVPKNSTMQTVEQVLTIFKNDYQKNMYNCTKPFDCIIKLLTELKKQNIKTAIVSNKFDEAVKELSNKYFANLIDVAIGQSNNISPKPSPDGVLQAIKILNVDIKNCIYVGDSDIDVKTAHNAGLQCIGVTWGYRNTELLKNSGADFVVNKPEDILKVI